MQDRVHLLNIAVDTLSTQAACDITIGYLQEEQSKVVYFLTSETLLLQDENPEWSTMIDECELILPGTSSVNASIDEALGYKRPSFFLESYFDVIFDYAIEMGNEILIVAENQERFELLQESLHEKRPFLTLSGLFITDAEQSLEHIVNEINSVAPDVLLVALDDKKQLELLRLYRNHINAGMLFFTSNTIYNNAVSEVEVSESISKLKMAHLYHRYWKGGRIKAFFNNLKMKFKLKRHKKEQEP